MYLHLLKNYTWETPYSWPVPCHHPNSRDPRQALIDSGSGPSLKIVGASPAKRAQQFVQQVIMSCWTRHSLEQLGEEEIVGM
jgi:hypothetical protein